MTGSRAAAMSLVARPSLRCVRATAKEVICPFTSADSSSLQGTGGGHRRAACAQSAGDTIRGATANYDLGHQRRPSHLGQHIAHNLAIIVLSNIEQLGPRERVVQPAVVRCPRVGAGAVQAGPH